MNDIGPPVGLQVNPLERETKGVRGRAGMGGITVGNKILTSSLDPAELNVLQASSTFLIPPLYCGS